MFVRRGEIGRWLTSEAFDLKQARSREGETAVCAALKVMGTKNPSLEEVESADQLLRSAGLPDTDLLWMRWDYFVDHVRNSANGVQK